MSRKRKEYEHGERINVYIKKDISQDMLDWINKQSDITTFFLYAAKQLYKETGSVDLATILPMKIDFNLKKEEKESVYIQNENEKHIENNVYTEEKSIKTDEPDSETTEGKKWGNSKDLSDDPYA